MSIKVTNRMPSLADAEWLLGEVREYYKRLDELRERLCKLDRDNPTRLDLLAEIGVAAEVLRGKLSSLISAIDAVEDEMPADDIQL